MNKQATAKAEPIEQGAEWVRLPKPKQTLCGLTRSYLHSLCFTCADCGKTHCKTPGHRPLIRSISNPLPGKKRGVRLLSLPSIKSYLAGLDAQQNGEKAP